VFGAFNAFKTAMLDHKQRHYAAMHMSHEVELRTLTVLLRYQQLLLAAVLQTWEFASDGTAQGLVAVDVVDPAAAAAAAAGLSDHVAAGLKGLQNERHNVGPQRTVVGGGDAAAAAATAAAAAAAELAVGMAGLPGARSVVSAIQDAAEVRVRASCFMEQQQQQLQVPGRSLVEQQQQQQAPLQSSDHVSSVPQQRNQGRHPNPRQQQQQQLQLQQQLQQQGFQPLPEPLLQQWLDCVVQCKGSLRWGCVCGFYLGSTSPRRQLEHATVSAR
jgi:hypothetical protein